MLPTRGRRFLQSQNQLVYPGVAPIVAPRLAKSRARIFEDFYKLKSHDAQNKYLCGLICQKPVKRHNPGVTRECACTTAYFVRISQGVKLQVCKKSFCDLHAIGKCRVEGLSEKIKAGVLIASDGCGRHTTRPHAVDNAVKEHVREHIASFPRRQSHYSRCINHK